MCAHTGFASTVHVIAMQLQALFAQAIMIIILIKY